MPLDRVGGWQLKFPGLLGGSYGCFGPEADKHHSVVRPCSHLCHASQPCFTLGNEQIFHLSMEHSFSGPRRLKLAAQMLMSGERKVSPFPAEVPGPVRLLSRMYLKKGVSVAF